MKIASIALISIILILSVNASLRAEPEGKPAEVTQQSPSGATGFSAGSAELAYAFDNVTLLVCAVLVLFMQAGFAMLTAGLNAAKNTVNILFKNFMDLCVGMILFAAVGFGLMYPGDAAAGGWFGFAGFGLNMQGPTVADIVAAYNSGKSLFHPQMDFLFQAAFAATAATIVAGSVSGRLKFSAYLIYSGILTGLIYPISGMWNWGGGWLSKLGFHDFAGSLVVHSVGGFAGLAATIALGPRIGKYSEETGIPRVMPAHNLTLATLGTFILWIGWYGFNPGSQLAFARSGDLAAMMVVAVNTSLAAAAGALASMIITWALYKKPELSMTLNGALAGLVSITANCDVVTNLSAVVIGAVGGILVVSGVLILDKLHIDDPVGAWPVHGLGGLWGGISTGIFGAGQSFWVQLLGSAVYPIWAFVTMLALFLIMRSVNLLRVTRDEELMGLDLGEHDAEAYAGFQIFTTN